MKRIPSLDGLRTLSIALVLLGHLYGTVHYPQNAVSHFLSLYAHFGVEVFFVISGFLITTLLLKEQQKNKRIDLISFYRRRTLRIFPAAFFFVTLMAIIAYPLGYLAYAYTYTMCYAGQGRPWLLGHLWSLSVEEQFYLLWPFAFAFAFRFRQAIAISVLLLAPIARLLFWHYGMRDIDEYFPAVADSIAAGCLLACYYGVCQRKLAWLIRTSWFLPIIGVALASQFLLFRVRLEIVLGGVPSLLIAMCIFAAIERRDWLLNNAVAYYGGLLSYSLYLWQQPFLNRHATAWWASFPINLVFVGACAVLSHLAVEKPFLRLSHAIAHQESKNSSLP